MLLNFQYFLVGTSCRDRIFIPTANGTSSSWSLQRLAFGSGSRNGSIHGARSSLFLGRRTTAVVNDAFNGNRPVLRVIAGTGTASGASTTTIRLAMHHRGQPEKVNITVSTMCWFLRRAIGFGCALGLFAGWNFWISTFCAHGLIFSGLQWVVW